MRLPSCITLCACSVSTVRAAAATPRRRASSAAESLSGGQYITALAATAKRRSARSDGNAPAARRVFVT
jgi:hypothetical protein